MRNIIYTILVVSMQFTSLAQTVGYQGKKALIEFGYVPLNALGAEFIELDFTGEYLMHNYKIDLEYIISRYGGVYLRYNPFNTEFRVDYFEDFAFNGEKEGLGYFMTENRGSMISAGYRGYFGRLNGLLAPMGGFYGAHISYFKFNSEIVDPKPQFENFIFENTSAIGLFGSMGVRGIIFNRITINAMFDFGWFLKAPPASEYYKAEGYYFYNDPSVLPINEAQKFFVLSPSLNLGCLLF